MMMHDGPPSPCHLRDRPWQDVACALLGPRDRAGVQGFPGSLGAFLSELSLGPAGAVSMSAVGLLRLAAARELGRRERIESLPPRPQVASPASAHRVLAPLFLGESVEVFRVLLLDARHRVLAAPLVSRGTLTSSLVHPREVLRLALWAGAAAFLVAHNHPSGDPAPSREDDGVTARLAEAAEWVGCPMLDHMVLGSGTFFSYRESRPHLVTPGVVQQSSG